VRLRGEATRCVICGEEASVGKVVERVWHCVMPFGVLGVKVSWDFVVWIQEARRGIYIQVWVGDGMVLFGEVVEAFCVADAIDCCLRHRIGFVVS